MIVLAIVAGLLILVGLFIILYTLIRFFKIEFWGWKLRRQPRLRPISDKPRIEKIG